MTSKSTPKSARQPKAASAAVASAPSAPTRKKGRATPTPKEISMSASGSSKTGIKGTYVQMNINDLHLWKENVRENVDKDKLGKLIESIREKGLLQPPVARNVGGKLEVIAGQRRTLALRALAEEGVIDQVLVLDIGEVDDSRALVISLIENIEREDITPSEEAKTVGKLYATQGLTLREIASEIGRPETSVRRLARISSLDQVNLELLDKGEITQGQAELLAEAPAGMRRQVLKWLKEGVDLDTARSMLSSRAARFDMKDALFSEAEYLSAAPGKIESDLFGATTATDRAAFLQLQEQTLQAKIEAGEYGEHDSHLVRLSAELPAELELQEDTGGSVLVGLISPINGAVRVVRASPVSRSAETQSVDAATSLRLGVMGKLRSVIARQVLESRPELAANTLPALLLMQLEGGPRSFTISRQASEVGRSALDTAHPERGMYGDLSARLQAGEQVSLTARLAELYEGTPETDALIIAAAGIKRIKLNAERLRTLSVEEIALLVPGVVRGTHEETVKQVEGADIELERRPLPTAQEWAAETRARLEATGLVNDAQYASVVEAIEDGNLSAAIDAMTPELQEGVSRAESQQRTSATFSDDEMVEAYDTLDASLPGVQEFRAAIDADDMDRARTLLTRLRA